MKRKVLAVLLTSAMSLQVLAGAAFADTTNSVYDASLNNESTEEVDDLTPVGTTFTFQGNSYIVLTMDTCALSNVSADNITETFSVPDEVEDPYGDAYKVTSIGKDAFSGAAGIRELILPDSIESYEGGGRLTDLETITVSENSENLILKDGVLYEKTENGYVLDLYPAAKEGEDFVIPSDVTEIRSRAFYGAKYLKTLVIPAAVKTIGEEAVAAFMNPASVVFNTEEAPENVSSSSVDLSATTGNVVYFLNSQVYEDITAEKEYFIDKSNNEEVLSVNTEGLTEEVSKLIADESAPLIEEEKAETQEQTEVQSTETSSDNTEEESAVTSLNGTAAAVTEGWYYITLKNHADMAIDINSSLLTSSTGANADVVSFSKSDAQLFHITSVDGGYRITPYSASDLVLECEGGSSADGTNVRQYRYNGSMGQIFNFDENGAIITYDGKSCLTCSGSNLVISTYAGTPDADTQTWTLQTAPSPASRMDTSVANGWYVIKNAVDESYVLDIGDGLGYAVDGANADIYTYDSSNTAEYFYLTLNEVTGTYTLTPYTAQSYALAVSGNNVLQSSSGQGFVLRRDDGDGHYRIEVSGTSSCLTAAEIKDSGNVSLAAYSESDSNQEWILTRQDPSVTYADISTGWYNINSKSGSFCLDINSGSGSTSEGGNADIYTNEDRDSQLFYIQLVDSANHYYTIKNYSNQLLYLDCNAAGYTAGTNVQIWTGNSGAAQKFRIIRNTDGSYRIVSSMSNACLTAASASDSANVSLDHFTGAATQEWTFAKTGRSTIHTNLPAGIYTIHTAMNASSPSDTSTLALAVDNDIMANDSNIVLRNSSSSDCQKFYLEPAGNGTYHVVVVAAWRSLDVKGGSSASAGANVQMHYKNDTAAQTWELCQNSEGYTYFRSTISDNYLLDVQYASYSDGANVEIYNKKLTANQLWTIGTSSYNDLSTGYYQLAPASGSRTSGVLQVNGSVWTTADRADNSLNQAFILTKTGSNTCTLYNAASDLYVAPDGLQSSAVTWTLTAANDGEGSFYLTHGGSYFTIWGSTKLSIMKTSVPNGWYGDYYISNGRILTNSYVGNAFLGSDGKLFTGWKQATVSNSIYKAGYYYYWDGKNGGATDARPWMVSTGLWGSTTKTTYINNHNNYTYTTNSAPNITAYDLDHGTYAYYIKVDTINCTVQIFTNFPGTRTFNTPVCAFKTSPGLPGTETNTGHSYIKAQKNWQELLGPSYGQYVSLVNYADGEYFHSVACGYANDYNVDAGEYNKLGQRASHGCMRLCVRNAYWIYAFVAVGTVVDISDKGYTLCTALLPQPKMTGAVAVDPTDVAYTGNYGYVNSNTYYGSYYGV